METLLNWVLFAGVLFVLYKAFIGSRRKLGKRARDGGGASESNYVYGGDRHNNRDADFSGGGDGGAGGGE